MSTTISTMHDKIYDLLDVELGSGLPTPVATIYKSHVVADLDLTGISVEPLSMISLDFDKAMYQSAPVENWAVGVSIRIHGAYLGGVFDVTAVSDLVDDIITILRENEDLGNGYRVYDISDVDFRVEFEESKTIGCEIKAIIRKVENYDVSS